MSDRTDEETVELIREWLQRYGLTIIAGIIIGLAGVGSYQWWENHQSEKRYQESATLDQLRTLVTEKKLPEAEKVYHNLQDGHSNISELAGLVLATGYQQEHQLEKALPLLQKVANEGKDILIQQTARWQAANISISLQKYDEAEALLATLQDSPYLADTQALKGYIYEKQGKYPEALQAYQLSLEISPNPITSMQMNAIAAKLAVKSEKKD